MNVAIALMAALLIQETHELKWNLKEGQKFSCSWVSEMKAALPETPLMELKFDVRGELTVRGVEAGTARCELALTTYAVKGNLGPTPLDMHFENGAIRRPDPESAEGKNLLRECLKPASIRLSPLGAYAFEGRHLLSGMFEGQSDFFGSRLPPGPVALGATWDGVLQSPQAKSQGRAPLKVKYKLESVSGDAARIVLDDRQDIRAAGRVMDFHAVTESTFDPRAGHCTRAKATIHVIDTTDPKRVKPDKPDIVMTLNFEMTEKR